MTRDGTTAFVALGPANRVAVVDVASLKVTNYILVGKRVWHMAFSSDGSKLYTTNGVSNDVTVIDIKTMKPIKSIPVGRYPWGIAVRGTGKNMTAGTKPAEPPPQ
jgi:YVTN family beta-propeller protein